jgi:hypothetical protein
MPHREISTKRGIEPITVTAKDGSKFSITLRISDALRKVNGKWLIAQEHILVPIDFESGKPEPGYNNWTVRRKMVLPTKKDIIVSDGAEVLVVFDVPDSQQWTVTGLFTNDQKPNPSCADFNMIT